MAHGLPGEPGSESYITRLEAAVEWEGQNRQRLVVELGEEMEEVGHLAAQRDRLLTFAQLVSDFCSDDSAGHMRYLKAQADIAINSTREES